MIQPYILVTELAKDYSLLDSGEGEKLERYGDVVVRRPDPQALWPKQLGENMWNNADAYFARTSTDSGWKTRRELPARWQIEFGSLQLWVKPTSFKHMGLFPEQAPNWDWVREKITGAKREINVLNLFGYTGGASLAAAQAGANVCHVDGSKVAIQWGRDNAALSGLEEKPIRWILEDAPTFVRREIKRGRKYDGIILDPPAFGHGPDGELWKIEDHFPDLLKLCREVMSDQPLFFLINGYASGYSAVAYRNNLLGLFANDGGAIEIGELTIAEENSERLLPCGIFARWSSI